MVSLIGEMNEICGRDNDGAASASEIKNLLDKHFPENEVNARIRRICDLLYPGVLSGIERDYPSLTRNDILLIALMACGFPTGAICAIRRLNVHSLNVQKTRTARKIAVCRMSEQEMQHALQRFDYQACTKRGAFFGCF